MTPSIAARVAHANHPTNVTVRETDLMLTLIPSSSSDNGRPIIGLDHHADVLKKGYLTLAEAAALEAALSALRFQATRSVR